MPEQLTLVAHFQARNGRAEETRDFLLSLIPHTRAEDGCIEYWLHQHNDDPSRFTFYENFASKSAWDLHMATDHLARFQALEGDLFDLLDVHQMTMICEPASKRWPS
ncbi:MAG: antibiotic biosynthesis monooxygenase [Devosiaceae bacterium]|nr:antibiotic biosynthesis monooxygenase [Devosiaceae bacterium MH13]